MQYRPEKLDSLKKSMRSSLFSEAERLKTYFNKYGGDIAGCAIAGTIDTLFKKYNGIIAYCNDAAYLDKINIHIVRRLHSFKRDFITYFKLRPKIILFTVVYILVFLILAFFAGILQSILGGLIGLLALSGLVLFVFVYKRFIQSIYDKIDLKEVGLYCDTYFNEPDPES